MLIKILRGVVHRTLEADFILFCFIFFILLCFVLFYFVLFYFISEARKIFIFVLISVYWACELYQFSMLDIEDMRMNQIDLAPNLLELTI